MTFVVGIDGGGTGCRAALSNASGRILGSGRSGPANIMSDFDGARNNIIAATAQAIAAAGQDPDLLNEISAFLGLAGANNPDRVTRMAESLPFRACGIKTDAHISLQGAIGDADGAAAIIGTGSVFINRIGDNYRTVGGWGFVVGDLGSGAWLGRALLQEVLLAHDGIHPATGLTTDILTEFGNVPQALVEYAQDAPPGGFARYAPQILAANQTGDPAARRIVAKAVTDIEAALDAIVVESTPQFCLLGGLGEAYGQLLGEPYRAMIRLPLEDAVSGAVALALKTFASGAPNA